MTELSNEPALPENDQEHQEKTSAPGIMITSLVLLIAGLLLSGTLLIQRAQEKSGNPPPRSGFSALIKKGKSLSSQTKAKVAEKAKTKPATEETKNLSTTPSGLNRFFSRTEKAARWPKLKLTGFGKSSDGETGFAIINEHHIIVGQKISKVTLVEIGINSVLVEYKGEQKTLSVDPTN